MNPLISVIVPVYNVEKYLNQCVESIINQTYENLELILVDDGSPDKCPQLCDEWAIKDSRIKVIHQNNHGGGYARNRALDIANGEYISFVDSDDYISNQMYEIMMSYFEDDIDIVECNYQIVTDNNYSFDSLKNKSEKYSMKEAMREHINDHIFRQLIWNKLYKISVISNVRFPEDKKIDDEFFTYKVIANSDNLIIIDIPLYAYRQQSNSVMHTINIRRRLEAIEAKINRHELICYKIPELMNESLINIWFSCIYLEQCNLRYTTDIEQKEFTKYIKDILKQYPIKGEIKNIKMSQIIWLYMVKISLTITCLIRNTLKIGL